MGQSAVNLPDPLGQGSRDRKGGRAAAGARPATAAAAADDDLVIAPAHGTGGVPNADDLLAQLAGEEVDRLLAEAREDAGAPAETNVDRTYPRPSAELPSVEILPAGATMEARRATAAHAADRASLVDPKDAALDDLFKQLGTEPLPLAIPAQTALAREERGDVLEQSLTARAQELIDAAQREAASDLALAASGPQAQAERAAFDAAVGRDGVAATVEHGLTVSPPVDRPAGESGARAEVAGAAASEAPSVAAALAEEMEQDERVHAGAVARLATAKNSVEAGSNAGKASGLSVTGIAVIGDDPEESPTAAPAAAAAAVEAKAAIAARGAVGGATPVVMAAAAIYDDGDEREPLFVRLLEWLNAPLENLSDSARAAIGRIAITTMVNALAILLYVLIFRR